MPCPQTLWAWVCVCGSVLCIRSTGSTTDPCSPQCVFISACVTRIVNTASSAKLRILVCVCVCAYWPVCCELWAAATTWPGLCMGCMTSDLAYQCASYLRNTCACDFSLRVRVSHAKRLIEGRASKLLPRETHSHPSPHWLFSTRLWTNKLMLNPLWAQGRRWGGADPRTRGGSLCPSSEAPGWAAGEATAPCSPTCWSSDNRLILTAHRGATNRRGLNQQIHPLPLLLLLFLLHSSSSATS